MWQRLKMTQCRPLHQHLEALRWTGLLNAVVNTVLTEALQMAIAQSVANLWLGGQYCSAWASWSYIYNCLTDYWPCQNQSKPVIRSIIHSFLWRYRSLRKMYAATFSLDYALQYYSDDNKNHTCVKGKADRIPAAAWLISCHKWAILWNDICMWTADLLQGFTFLYNNLCIMTSMSTYGS